MQGCVSCVRAVPGQELVSGWPLAPPGLSVCASLLLTLTGKPVSWAARGSVRGRLDPPQSIPGGLGGWTAGPPSVFYHTLKRHSVSAVWLETLPCCDHSGTRQGAPGQAQPSSPGRREPGGSCKVTSLHS